MLIFACGGITITSCASQLAGHPLTPNGPVADAGTTWTPTQPWPSDAGTSGNPTDALPPPSDAHESVHRASEQWPYRAELGLVGEAQFEVPPNTIGVHYAPTDPLREIAAASSVVDPSGRAVFTNDLPYGVPVHPDLPYLNAFPVSSAGFEAGIIPGIWTMRAFSDVPIRVYLQMQSPAGYQGGVLDLHVHLPAGLTVDGSPVTAQNAEANAGLQARIAAFFQLLQQHLQWGAGQISYHDAPADLVRIRYTTDHDQVGRAARVGNTFQGQPGLHILVVSEILADVSGFAPLTASAEPGVHAMVVELAAPAHFAMTCMHELGHFVGLDHTSDVLSASGLTDLIDDTPVCTESPDTVERCPDYNNLMFPSSGTVLTEQQRAVYRANPIYRPNALTSISLDNVAASDANRESPSDTPAAPSAHVAADPADALGAHTHPGAQPRHGVCGITMARAAQAVLSGTADRSRFPWLANVTDEQLHRWQRWGHLSRAFRTHGSSRSRR